MSTTTAMPTATRNIRDVVVALQHVADLFSSHTGEDLAFPVQVQVTLSAGFNLGADDAKRAMVDQVARLFGTTADYTSQSDHAPYTAKVTMDGQPWQLIASAYVKRPDPNDALHAELEQLRAKVAAFEAVVDERETYAQAELDQDRNPTAAGFAAWQTRRAEQHQAHQDGRR